MKQIKIKDTIYWVGAVDPDMKTFDLVFKTDHGTTYNSYLIMDRKTALIDTVKEPFTEDFIVKITALIDPKRIDFIVISHTEPDHSGALLKLLKLAGNAKIIISKSGGNLLREITNTSLDVMFIEEHESINLGTHNLTFIPTPYLHWPDAFVTYIEKEKIIFTCDIFGSHFCDERMFDDVIGDFDYSFEYYYDCIMRPFKPYVLKAMEKFRKINVTVIAPGHGPILRTDPGKYIERYSRWSQNEVHEKKRVLVLYLSVYGNTKRVAEAIAGGISEENMDVILFDINDSDYEEIRNEIEDADGILVGSPTIAGDAPGPIWHALSLISTVKSNIRLGAAFGSYGWSGEATGMIEERLKGLHIKLHKPSLKIRLVPDGKSLVECHKFGKIFANALGLILFRRSWSRNTR
ncbi:MAG: FprA family A-type flavoprotein [Candidatus Scalindua sp. AMX11]|nr:MAG: FprA family A-type flavoprotein [Candidatus Scalindua sp.]NOG82621.1 FprA family A-type flavoprotein [Planctomycetota bacterium]RZV78305.1 MAG: FprA family A-type flavoprotein [Candidatus Scalindua sp. SCAELEC01]TDE65145.1 MAG: FprA family A-type flavoprotein [Candidatus Scalindua sp. AMX11]GJQ59503.1 MAG: FprA family A-type flavoprotein [Candidatus Scalindua sp.]